MSKRATIKSIAADLGISHMTVSRALSGHPNVQRQTRDAVLRRARELGYVRSAAAGAMRGEDTRIVGLLLPNLVNDFYARFANTMALDCETQNHQLIIHLTDDDAELETRALARLGQVRATAIVMVPAPDAAHMPAMGGDTRIVQLIRQRGPAAASVSVDDAPAIGDAVRCLAGRGHRRIGYVGGADRLSSGKERLAAFRAGLAAAGLKAMPDLIQTGAPSFDFGRGATRKLLSATQATALVCGGFEISSGALDVLMSARRERPDFDMVSYGDPPHLRWIAGGISAIGVPVDDLADAATRAAIGGGDPDGTATACPAVFIGRAGQVPRSPSGSAD